MTRAPLSGLTGTHVATSTGFAVLLPYSAVSMLLANPDLQSTSVVSRLAATFVAQVALFAVLVAWRWCVVQRPGWGSTPTRVLAALVIASIIRAVLLAELLQLFGVTHGIDWPRRLFGAVIGFSAALVIVDLALGSISRHRALVALLRDQQQAAIRARETTIADMAEQRAAVAERIRADFMARFDQVSGADPAASLAALRSTSSELLRPLAADLARESTRPPPVAEPPAPKLDVRAFLSEATSGRPFGSVWTAVLFLCFAGPFLLLAAPIMHAIGMLATGLVAIWLLLSPANAAMARFPTSMRLSVRVTLMLALMLASSMLLVLSSVLFVDPATDPLHLAMVGYLLLVPAIALALVAARAAETQARLTEDRMRASASDLDWASTRTRCIRWQQQRSLASALHGPVQSAVGVATIRLELAVQEGSADAVLLDELRTQLVAAIDHIDDRTTSGHELESALEEFAGTWSGVCEIRWSITPSAQRALQNDTIALFVVRELATEGCWNAIRHAHATRVDILVDADRPRVLRLEVDDDGIPPDRPVVPGLGSAMLDDMTISWMRTRSGRLTTLDALVPTDVT